VLRHFVLREERLSVGKLMLIPCKWDQSYFPSRFLDMNAKRAAPRRGLRAEKRSHILRNKYICVYTSEFRRSKTKGREADRQKETCRSQIAEVVDDSIRWTALCTNHMQNVGTQYEYMPRQWHSPISLLSIVSRAIVQKDVIRGVHNL